MTVIISSFVYGQLHTDLCGTDHEEVSCTLAQGRQWVLQKQMTPVPLGTLSRWTSCQINGLCGSNLLREANSSVKTKQEELLKNFQLLEKVQPRSKQKNQGNKLKYTRNWILLKNTRQNNANCMQNFFARIKY